MKIYEHPACNMVVKPAPGDEGHVLPLPVYLYVDEGVTQKMSFWKPSPEELALLNANGYIAVNIIGQISPFWVGVGG